MKLIPELVAPARSSSVVTGAHRPAPPLRTKLSFITLAWVFGAIWFNTTTGEPLTVFAQKLGASNFQFGLLTAMPFLASLMAVPGSLLIEWTGRRKRVFLWSLYLQRALWFLIPLAPLVVLGRGGVHSGTRALWVFLALMFVMYASGATGGPAWLAWMSDIVPARINGKYFSRRRQWGILSAVPAAVFVGWFLDREVPVDSNSILRWCAIFFLCSAVCGLMDIHFFRFVPAAPRPPRRGVQLLTAFREPLANRQFLHYSMFAGMLTFAVNLLGQFATLYMLENVGVTNMSAQMVLVVTPMLAQLAVLGGCGRAADRMGKRPLLVIASAGLVPVGLAWCFVTPNTIWLAYVLSALGAALWTGVEVANMNLVLEASAGGSQKGSSGYAAVNSVIINVAGCLGGLAAGAIAQVLRDRHWQPVSGFKSLGFFDALFLAGAALRLICFAGFLPLLQEPSARSSFETLRFLVRDLCGTLIDIPRVIRKSGPPKPSRLQPLASLRLGEPESSDSPRPLRRVA